MQTNFDERPMIPLRKALYIAASTAVVLGLSGCGQSSGTREADSATVPSSQDAGVTTDIPESTGVPETTSSAAEPVGTVDLSGSICLLLTKQDVEAAFGESVTMDDGGFTCRYETKTALKTVEIDSNSAETDEWQAGYVDNDSWEPIDLGSGGWAGKDLPSIEFRYKDTRYEINVAWSTEGDPYKVVRELATKVESRLP